MWNAKQRLSALFAQGFCRGRELIVSGDSVARPVLQVRALDPAIEE
jgi:hypothetical protein